MSTDFLLKTARIVELDKDFNEVQTVNALFNPEEYTITKGNLFATIAIPGQNIPITQFIRGNAETLSLKLFFDTYTYENGIDVRNAYVNKITDLMRIKTSLHAPPVCRFEWGEFQFLGVISKADRTYTMFKEDGTPVRATVNLTINQVKDVLDDRSRASPDRTKIRLITDKTSLWMLAYFEYGDQSKWKLIAEANGIDDPLNLPIGSQIIIPPLPE